MNPRDSADRLPVGAEQPDIDYAGSGLTIATALLQKYAGISSSRDLGRETPWITLAGRRVHTSDRMAVPRSCIVTLDLLRAKAGVRQGFDLKVHGGGLLLAHGTRVGTLRTWWDPDLEDHLEYAVESRAGYIATWNVYELPIRGEPVVEYWTGNAGMWIERDGPTSTYHCSAGGSATPDFDDLTYRVTVL